MKPLQQATNNLDRLLQEHRQGTYHHITNDETMNNNRGKFPLNDDTLCMADIYVQSPLHDPTILS
jgi:hypothetical protein